MVNGGLKVCLRVSPSPRLRVFPSPRARANLAVPPCQTNVSKGFCIFKPCRAMFLARFLSELLRQRKRQPREEPAAARKLAATPATWEQMVKAVEKLKGESWEQFSERHGDWGRDAVLWLGRFCYYHLVPGLLLR